jgi:hypothetical protein
MSKFVDTNNIANIFFNSGTKIVTIANELGRGVYGVVLLYDDKMGQSNAFENPSSIGIPCP